MNDRRSRFERLERPRPAGHDGQRPSTADRFADVGGGDAPAPQAPASVGDRFREPAPRPPEVAEASAEEQPFIRCRRCETDNSRYGRSCTTCGEELHGPEQRAFNEALWAERRRQRIEEERLAAERHAGQARAEAELAAARRSAAEEMAREVGRRERARLESEEGGWGGGAGDPWGGHDMGGSTDRSSLAMRLLRRIADPRWRIAAVAGYVGLLVLLVALARVNRLFLAAAMILLVLALPPSAWRWGWRRRWWW